MPGRLWDLVVDVAVDHGGYVTPALVEPSGVAAVELRKMASRGTLVRVGHGVYRVPVLPLDDYDEFLFARLWSNGRGVVSHDSALLVHELCDINPTLVHLTIPPSFRISRRGADSYAIHRALLEPTEITELDGVVLTTIRRTLTDAAPTVPAYLVAQAIDTAMARGAIREADAAALRSAMVGS